MKTLCIATIIAFTSLIGVGLCYADLSESLDRNYRQGSYTFGSGYINAAKARSEAIVRQMNEKIDRQPAVEKTVESVKSGLSRKVAQDVDAAKQVKPELKQKSSSKSGKYALAPKGSINVGTNYNVSIGTGEAAHYVGGRLVWEYINGIKHIYAGFKDVGYASDGTTSSIQKAINQATTGDIVLVCQGTYTGTLSLRDTTRLYGGFNNSGERNVSQNLTNIVGTVNANGNSSGLTEINGFDLRSSHLNIKGNFLSLNINDKGWIGGHYVYSGAVWHYDDVTIRGAGVGTGYKGERGAYMTGTPLSADAMKVSTLSGPQRMVLVEQASQKGLNEPYNTSLSDYGYRNAGEDGLGGEYYAKSGKTEDYQKKPLKTGAEGILLDNKKYPDGASDAVRIMRDALDGKDPSLSAIGSKDQSGEDAVSVHMLINNLKNPTNDQKMVLDAVRALMADTDKGVLGSQSPELNKAQNDLLNAVANILLAQGIPDLFKQGDAANIKAIFSELDNVKNKIMLDYERSTKPYYENIVRDMAKNMAMLQVNNILNPEMTKEELAKLPPSELDRILAKIKSMKDRTFEGEYLLQQEAKYRKEYIEPNKKKLEEDMKGMLNNFTGRINDALKSTEKK